jgi:myo-inositol-1(or 4)-monophosphatase
MTPTLETAIKAATRAGNVLRRKFREPREVKSKGWRDIVTDSDFAAQKVVLDTLTARFPKYRILSEEGQPSEPVDLSAPEPTWVIDPLDGTTNYARQFPSFSVSIALIHKGDLRVGVIHEPLRRETFYAERGHGAFLKFGSDAPRRLHVSALTDFGNALIGVDWARDPALRRRVVEALARVSSECRSVRAVGSAALGLAYTAAGWLDGYYHLSLFPWDVAAGALLVLESGGALSRPDGSAWQLVDRQVVASNALQHQKLLTTLQL